jgi:hypothetical protein
MNIFDKMCATLSIGIGAIFMVLGVFGLFFGANAHFTLPPILGGLPFFLGWGMCVPLVKFWKMSRREAMKPTEIANQPDADDGF